MNEKKTQLTPEQIYKRNQSRAKTFKILGPVVFWSLLLLAIVFLIISVCDSLTNVNEIFNMLDKNKYSGEEIEENYKYLVEKWGEWEIVGEGQAGLVIRYVNVPNALFSKVVTIFFVLSMVCLCLSVVLGKIVFPLLSKHFVTDNENLVDIATLKSAQQIDEITKKKEWF